MNGPSDPQLLRDYAEQGAEAAFDELVRRHVDLVYSAALRMVRDPHLAEDVTQSVFLALSRNARQLTACPVLSGWLHRTTQNLAANMVRTEVRRRAREQKAVAMNEMISTEPDPAWEEVGPHLDSALGELGEADRDAVLLRYFEQKSAREMAQVLGTSEEAAQKRVNRAVERLRELFGRRGVAVGASGLAGLLSAHAVEAAPAGLALSITSSVPLAGAIVVPLATVTSTSKTLLMTTLQKTLFTSALAAAIGVGIYEARQVYLLRGQIQTFHRQQNQTQPSPVGDLATLQNQIEALEAQKRQLTGALSQANADKVQLQTEREQARSSAALYKELADQASLTDKNPTNIYPTQRHVWAAFGKMGRLAALAKEDNSRLTAEEKSALEAAKTKALEDLPTLVKAAKQFDAARSSETDLEWDNVVDEVACLLYGALNLDEQQFNQVYLVMQKLGQEAKQKGLSKEAAGPEGTEAIKRMMEQWKTETVTLLTPEQAKIFTEVVSHFQVEPGKFGFNFNF